MARRSAPGLPISSARSVRPFTCTVGVPGIPDEMYFRLTVFTLSAKRWPRRVRRIAHRGLLRVRRDRCEVSVTVEFRAG